MNLDLPPDLFTRIQSHTIISEGVNEITVIERALDSLEAREAQLLSPEQLSVSLAMLDESERDIASKRSLPVSEAMQSIRQRIGIK